MYTISLPWSSLESASVCSYLLLFLFLGLCRLPPFTVVAIHSYTNYTNYTCVHRLSSLKLSLVDTGCFSAWKRIIVLYVCMYEGTPPCGFLGRRWCKISSSSWNSFIVRRPADCTTGCPKVYHVSVALYNFFLVDTTRDTLYSLYYCFDLEM